LLHPAGDSYGIDFTPASNAIAVSHANSPHVSAYPWSSGFGTKYANPASAVISLGYDVAFSANGDAIAVAYDTPDYINAYAWSSGFGTKYSSPATLPADFAIGVTFI
jgi:hypothetical protein